MRVAMHLLFDALLSYISDFISHIVHETVRVIQPTLRSAVWQIQRATNRVTPVLIMFQ